MSRHQLYTGDQITTRTISGPFGASPQLMILRLDGTEVHLGDARHIELHMDTVVVTPGTPRTRGASEGGPDRNQS